ncbi:hypothetical protein [uncultured Dokdonia sp.]|uniref:hypothetical protein n=1 Tax=uncultured Dokdonia sp. TaxID=575653 RepID=UPI00262DFB05|nr:hypothetical protein [uncultured Dokdonia sp.]
MIKTENLKKKYGDYTAFAKADVENSQHLTIKKSNGHQSHRLSYFLSVRFFVIGFASLKSCKIYTI